MEIKNIYRFRKLKGRLGWILKTNSLSRKLIINYISRKNRKNEAWLRSYIDSADPVYVENCKLRLGIIKDEDKLSLSLNTYWPKFERFAKNNKIDYSFLNIHADNWIEESAKYDLIVWRPLSNPSSLYEARTKINYIEKFLKIRCYPSAGELYLYEDKIKQYNYLKSFHLPVIPTFISFDEEECLGNLDSFEYPLISKSYIGSASLSVSKIKNKSQARRHISRVFSGGINTGFKYFRQNGYVFLQKYIDDAEYDLRILIAGKKIFGYYRMLPKNDFRASGAGLVVKDALPLDAVLLAMKVKECMQATVLAVDLLKSKRENQYYIIETSITIDIETPAQLMVNEVPGYYLVNNNSLEFHPGKFWIQELLLEELIRDSRSGTSGSEK